MFEQGLFARLDLLPEQLATPSNKQATLAYSSGHFLRGHGVTI